MFGVKKKRPRRSEMRLGAEAIQFQTIPARPALSFGPVLDFWQLRGAKITGVLVLAGLGWLLYAIFTTSMFFVYRADIKGNQALSKMEVYRASGIDSQSIFWLNPAEIERRLAALPNIKSAQVSLALPAGVTIRVTERRPQLLWQTGDKIWWIDEEGTVVPPKAQIEGMLKIIDDDLQPLEVGFKIDPTVINGAQALQLLAPNVTLIRHTRAKGLIVATPEGWPVYLGDGSEMRAKLMVLSAILPDLRQEKQPPLYIDLRNPLRPIYKLKPEFHFTTQPVQPRTPLLPRQPATAPQIRP